ncbi:MAG: hypothetical protein NXI01_01080 [Gammaproteobacteria bacterium]|nr:hypothetical protein [Gammaproteobacteria bacterium]
MSLGLSGCNGLLSNTEFASNNETQYLKSKNGKDLVVKPPLSSENISDFYRLPNQTQAAKVSIKPPTEK